jgi:hypothetical protein
MPQQWLLTTQFALQDAWDRMVSYLPNLIGSIVILIIGVLIASILKWIVQRVIEASRLQGAFDQLEFTRSLKKANISTNLGSIIGEFVRWLVIIIFLQPAATVLGLSQISNVLNGILSFLPNVGSAVLILFLGVLFAEFLGNIVRATAAGLGSRTAAGLAVFTQNIIFVLVGLFALSQLVTAPQVIYILLIGFVAAAAIALGLAFGLGGKDAAHDFIDRMKNEMASK